MRFDHLNLQAFGHFTNFELPFDSEKNIHILYGRNEAGKSTILRSVSNLLYGFPQQTTDSFLHSNQKLRIGGQLRKRDGETLVFYRRKGRKNTVLDSDNQPLNEKEVEKFLNGISEQQFSNMFALDHVRLRQGGESLFQSDGNVGESLFSAASGISELREVLEELDNTARSIYLKSGSKPRINQAIKKEKELTKQITESQLKVQEWKALEQSYLDGERQIEEIKEEVKNVGIEETKYRRLKQTLPKIALRHKTIEKLYELSDTPDLPDHAEQDKKAALQQKESAQQNWKTVEGKINNIQQDIENLSIPTEILNQEMRIEELYRQLDGYQHNSEQLPSLEGKQRQLEQQVLSALKEIDAKHTRLENIEQYRISAVDKKAIRELSEQYPLLEQESKNSEKEVADIKKELQKQNERLAQLDESVDVTSLESAINKVKEEGKIETQLHEKQLELVQLEQEINTLIDRLSLWNGTSDELTQLQIPNLKNTIKKYEQKEQALTQELQQIKQKISEGNKSIEVNEKRIRELESLADIPTEKLLQDLRQHRDKGWLIIRDRLNNQSVEDQDLQAFTQGLPLDLAFEKSIGKADDTADLMRREAEKLGEKNKLIADIEVTRAKVDGLEKEYASIEEKQKAWHEKWKNEWRPAKIDPLTPSEMIEWMEKYEYILSLIFNKQKLEQEVTRLVEKRDTCRKLLQSSLQALITLSKDLTLAELLDKAEEIRKQVTKKENDRVNLQDRKKDLKEKLDHAKERQDNAITQIEQWHEAWVNILDGVPISVTTMPTIAPDLLETFEAAVQQYEELQQNEEIIKQTKNQVENFRQKVLELKQALPQSFMDMSIEMIVVTAYKELNNAKQDKVNLENLTARKQELQQEKRTEESIIKKANETLSQLMQQAGCDTLEELEQIEEAFKQKQSEHEKLARREEEIVEVGDGLTLEQLLEEAKTVDHDAIDYHLEEISKKKQELDKTRSDLEQSHGVVKQEYKDKIAGANSAAVQAAEEKESVLANITKLTDQYVNHKLASLLLQKGIEYYREKNQSPIMSRASELFRRLTLDSFDGIIVDFDEKDQPVMMGIRNDEKIKIAGMSDGTTDQLYLALRIASIEKYVSENEPIPFIVDDILVHFDDARAKETLKILVGLSHQTQVIFFTHHERLVELMRDIVAENLFESIELNNSKQSVFM
ncbi:chromosome segregation protein [Paraliobacillus sp. PM-2]|uniref:YhaN family protein n=1 Tax=Paraliobacillus sp. PM-2 TaxID=1462524 RepID=UPI00061CB7F3|nr:YhaN family protein [Paraliobacillus sp. PM-2]CQR47161.1 chromosome segregation protein [Paraliobacillus sp. PM-2]